MLHNNIVSAKEWLPDYLFTEEIVEAAVESKEIEVLSHIPGTAVMFFVFLRVA